MARSRRAQGPYLHVSLDPATVIVMPPPTSTLAETEEGLAMFGAALGELADP